MTTVKVGQIWQCNDPRYKHEPRQIEIIRIFDDVFALCRNIKNGVISKNRLDRFKENSRGFCLIKDV